MAPFAMRLFFGGTGNSTNMLGSLAASSEKNVFSVSSVCGTSLR
jgi:hypothetical protein